MFFAGNFDCVIKTII